MERRTPAADALTDLILEIFRVNGDLLTAGDQLTRESGQTSGRWQVLGAVRNGAQPVAGIARDMGLARQSVQRTADLLEAAGLVEYAPNPAHRRAKLVRLTEHGREILGAISARQVAWTNRLVTAMGSDEAEIRQALGVLTKLRAELEAAGRSTGDGSNGEGHRADREGSTEVDSARMDRRRS